MTTFDSYRVYASTMIDDETVAEPSEELLRTRLGDRKFDWLETRGHISWTVFGVSKKGETLIAKCIDEASARNIANILKASVPVSTVETTVELSVLFYGKSRNLSAVDGEAFNAAMDKVEGQRGANDLIAELTKQIENDAELFGVEWGEDCDYYIAMETAADLFFEEFMARSDEFPFEAISRMALLGEGALDSARRGDIINANVDELEIDTFIRTTVENGVIPIDQAYHLQVYFNAFADKAEDAYGYREFADDRQEEIVNTFITLDSGRINDWNYIKDHALNLCLELGEEANLDPNPYGK